MRKSTVIKQFCKAVFGLPFSVYKYHEWATNSYDTIYFTLDCDEGDVAFRENFISRCPIAEKYSDALLSVLHEMGHIATSEEMDWAGRDDCESYEEYFAQHDEMLATNWAIDWLNNKANEKLAKVFEEKWLTAE